MHCSRIMHVARLGIAAGILGAVFWSCSTAQETTADNGFRVISIGRVNQRVQSHVVVDEFPDYHAVHEGMAAGEVFQVLGNATSMGIGQRINPDWKQLEDEGRWPPLDESKAPYLVTDAARWRLCRADGNRYEMLRIFVGFIKRIRPKFPPDFLADAP